MHCGDLGRVALCFYVLFLARLFKVCPSTSIYQDRNREEEHKGGQHTPWSRWLGWLEKKAWTYSCDYSD